MTQDISSLVDGELQSPETERVIRSCCADAEAARKWNEYHLIGEALRGENPRRCAVADRVMEALADEPTVLAPRAGRAHAVGRMALAAAASVATIGVVGWMGMQQFEGPAGPAVAQAPVPKPAVAKAGESVAPRTPAVVAGGNPASGRQVSGPVIPTSDVQDYLVVHRQIPSAEFYRPVAATSR